MSPSRPRAPRWFQVLPIRRKLAWILVTASATALTLAAIGVGIYDATIYRDRVRREADGVARLIAPNLTAPLSFGDHLAATEVLAGLRATSAVSAAVVFDARGREMARWIRSDLTPADLPALTPRQAEFEGPYYRSVIPVRFGGDVLGELELLYGSSSVVSRAAAYGPLFGVLALVLAAVSLLLFGGLERNIALPVLALSDTAHRIGQGQHGGLRATRHAPDEIGALTDSFNSMLDALQVREAELRSSEQNLQLAMEAAGIGVWVVDLANNRVQWSQQLRGLFGQFFEPEPLTLNDIFARVHPDDIPALRKTMAEAVLGGRPDQAEFRMVHADGRQAWCRAIGRVIPGLDGRPERIIGVAMNTTRQHESEQERLTLEQQVIQAQRMESIGTLAGGVAHDFNNLLTAMLGNLGMAREMSDDPQALEGLLTEIEEAVNRAGALTRQLLLFGRRAELQREPVDLGREIDDLMRMLRRLIGENIVVRWELPKTPVAVLGDASQLDQVVMNLAVNARDAMPGGGVLAFELQTVVLDQAAAQRGPSRRTGAFAELVVTDSGSGMTSEILHRIFEPFFTTKGLGVGTGLGLAVVYGIVKNHEGWIEVDSELGRGSSFRIYLPITEVPGARTGAEAMGATPGGSETVLVAEDDPLLRRMVGRTLTRLGYQVILAENGRRALELFGERGHDVDLALLDMVMPEMSGQEVFHEIRRIRPELPVILSTGYSETTLQDEVSQNRLVWLLSKPYNQARLTAALREALAPTGNGTA
ncbi:MAG TPA: response regulator [Gemmatimonadales bacterium]|nr:response regulator [Gemmatimonadales bacterium]